MLWKPSKQSGFRNWVGAHATQPFTLFLLRVKLMTTVLRTPTRNKSTITVRDKLLGQLLDGRYQVIDRLSRGGFGETYVAQDTRRPGHPNCVVKRLKPLLVSGFDQLEDIRQRFHREAETLEKLGDHDQIPRLLAHFEADGEFFLVQEFVRGHSLSVELPPNRSLSEKGQKNWSEAQVIQLLQEVLSILAFVHSQGVIHRDVKPENLIRRRQDGRLVLIDFGAVKQLQSLSTQSETAEITTPIQSEGYTPLEQICGKPCPSSDLYALGMICVQALTGRHPKDFEERLHMEEMTWTDSITINPKLAALLKIMTRRHWKNRYQSVAEIQQDLQDLQPSQPSINSTTVLKQPSSPAESPDYTPTQIVDPPQPPQLSITLPMLRRALSHLSNPGTRWNRQSQPVHPPAKPDPTDTANTSKRKRNRKTIDFYPTSRVQARVQTLSQVIWGLTFGGAISTGLVFLIYLIVGLMSIQQSEPTTTPTAPPTDFLLNILTDQSSSVRAIAFGPNDRTLISTRANTIEIWDLETNQPIQTLTGHFNSVTALAISPDGRLLASGSADANINIWDLQTGELRQTLRGHQWSVLSVAFNANGRLLVSSAEDETIKLWDVEAGKSLQTLANFKAVFASVDISSDGSRLVGGSADNTIRIWNLYTGKLLHTLRGHSDQIHAVAISPNGALFASASADNTVKLWNLYTGKLHQTLEGHTEAVHTVVISASGRRLASGSADRTIRLWDLQAGELHHTFSNPESAVHSVAISSDEQTLASSSLNGTLKIWRMP